MAVAVIQLLTNFVTCVYCTGVVYHLLINNVNNNTDVFPSEE